MADLPAPGALDAGAIALLERYFGLRVEDEPQLFGALEMVDLAGGAWLFHQGDPGDSLYFLVRGRLKAWRDLHDQPGEEDVLLGEVVPGESVGEVGLLTGHPRSAGVRAIRDSLLVRIGRDTFVEMAARNPALVMKLAASVADRLRQNMQPGGTVDRPLKTIALLPLDDTPRCRAFCDALVAGLSADGRTVDLRRETLGESGAPRHDLAPGEPVDAQLKDWLGDQELATRHVVYRCDPSATPWSTFCRRQADLVLRVAEASSAPAQRDWEKELDARCAESGGSRQALVLLQPEAATPITGTLAWLEPRQLDFHLHVRADRPDDVQRVVRVLVGSATGLVLGAGAVRGFAHLGVNRALKEAGVAIDWYGGSSIGSIMAASMAYDWPAARSLQAAHDAFVKGKPFSDYTLPFVSLLSGGRMRKLLRRHLPGNIEDLPIPFFCVSSNLTTGKSNVHQRGEIWKALSASAALPGVMPPAVYRGQLAIDGSVLNSLPVDVMQEMPVARVIAVDLSTRKEYALDYKYVPSAWTILRSKLFGGKRARVPGVATLMLKSTEIGTVARVRELVKRADLLLAPAVDRFNILDVTRFDDIVEAGYAHAREVLPGWLASQAATRAEATREP
jgi:NTE family protein